jgi:hypothetical protein
MPYVYYCKPLPVMAAPSLYFEKSVKMILIEQDNLPSQHKN